MEMEKRVRKKGTAAATWLSVSGRCRACFRVWRERMVKKVLALHETHVRGGRRPLVHRGVHGHGDSAFVTCDVCFCWVMPYQETCPCICPRSTSREDVVVSVMQPMAFSGTETRSKAGARWERIRGGGSREMREGPNARCRRGCKTLCRTAKTHQSQPVRPA